MVRNKPMRSVGSNPTGRLRKAVWLVLAIALGGGLIGYASAQSSISLNSPVSFPVDI